MRLEWDTPAPDGSAWSHEAARSMIGQVVAMNGSPGTVIHANVGSEDPEILSLVVEFDPSAADSYLKTIMVPPQVSLG